VTQQDRDITSLSEANREGDMRWRAVWVAENGFKGGQNLPYRGAQAGGVAVEKCTGIAQAEFWVRAA